MGGNQSGILTVNNSYSSYGAFAVNNSRNNQRVSGGGKHSIPEEVTVAVGNSEQPIDVHRRMLLEAASRAGLDGTDEQRKFVEKFLGGLEWSNSQPDPTPNDSREIRKTEVKSGSLNYKLNDAEKTYLRELQIQYQSRGGRLHPGGSYRAGSKISSADSKYGDRIADEKYERARAAELLREAQILPSSVFGTPAKLRDLKRVPNVSLADVGDLSLADRALLGYITEQYGGNIWGDKQREILNLAKLRGVKIENLTVENGRASFDISVENLLKLHATYVTVQEQVNRAEEIVNNVRDKMALNQFLIGAGEGAWDAVKANYNLVRHPLQTVEAIGEAVKLLANLSEEDLLKIYESLKAAGKEFVFEKDLSEVARSAGKTVGAAAIEFILGKGIGAGLKALRATKAGIEFLNAANKLKQSFGKMPIPVPGLKVIADTTGGRMILPDVEVKKLEDLIKPLESRAQKILSGGRRDLNIQELSGGHTIERHVGKSESWLRKRLENDPDIGNFASSFRNEAIANRVQGRFVNRYKAEIKDWLSNSQSARLIKEIDMEETVGIIVERGKSGYTTTNKATLILIKDTSPEGWHFLTSFPNK